MARHGGTPRVGGFSSAHIGGVRHSGGGSGVRSSKKPFEGCYNRSYYDKRGKLHTYYTNDINFGTKNGVTKGLVFAMTLITVLVVVMLIFMFFMFGQIGFKINGNRELIAVYDNIDILSSREEKELVSLFEKVYDKTGMPIMLFTEPKSELLEFDSIEEFSEDLLYSYSDDENSMAIVWVDTSYRNFYRRKYDFCCGDNTVWCFSDETFEELLSIFKKAEESMPLADALDHTWNEVMDDLATTKIDPIGIVVFANVALFYGFFLIVLILPMIKSKQAQKYFEKNPDKLEMRPMKLNTQNTQNAQPVQPAQIAQQILPRCYNCGARNENNSTKCPYCNSSLIYKK